MRDIDIEVNHQAVVDIKKYINEEKKLHNGFEIVFLCIGTDRMIGDSFGPLVGTKIEKELGKYNYCNINVFGTLESNVCYTNIFDTLDLIEKRYKNPYIITVDSALANKEYIGKIVVNKGKLHLGKGLNKKKIEIGNLSIRAIVGKDTKIPKCNFIALQNISLNMIMKMSDIVSNSIVEAIKK